MTDSTPGATTETAAAALSTPVAETPTTIDGALEQSFAKSLAAEPATPSQPETPAPTGEVPAIAEPQAQPTDPAATKQGPIPFEVHHKALENARLKAAEETQARLVQEYQSTVQPVLSVAQAIAQDVQTGSIEGLNQLINEYASHPTLGPQLRSWFGKQLSGMRQPAQDPRPEPDMQTADGTLVYSGPQQQALDEWRDRQWQQRLQQTIQPYEQNRQQQEQQKIVTQLQTQAVQTASQILADYRADPDFKANELEIKRLMAEKGYSLDRAWQQVYREVVVPKQIANQNQSWVTAAVKKSQGSTPDPAASAPVQPRRPRTVDEGLDQVFDQLSASR